MIGMCKRRNVSLQYFDLRSCGSMAKWLGEPTGAKQSGFTFSSASLSSLSLPNAVTISVAVSSSEHGDNKSAYLIGLWWGLDEVSQVKSLEHCLTHGKAKVISIIPFTYVWIFHFQKKKHFRAFWTFIIIYNQCVLYKLKTKL